MLYMGGRVLDRKRPGFVEGLLDGGGYVRAVLPEPSSVRLSSAPHDFRGSP